LLKVENLSKHFGGVRALQNINLEVRNGELRGIMGPNGSGKSTFVNLITGYLTPTSGRIFFKGEDITTFPPEARVQRGIGRIFQITNIFPNLSVYDNIWIAVQSKNKKRSNFFINRNKLKDVESNVEEILELIGLSHKAYEIAKNCSYGEQRLIEIGIIMGLDPELLLLDEPTAGLSEKERNSVVKLIKDLARSKTIVLIEHAMDVMFSLAEFVTVFHEGKIIAEGIPKEIASNEEVQKIYLGEI
jgi:branched-chain amino acid transport system ATP-binding protein